MSQTATTDPENDVGHLPRRLSTAKVLGTFRRGLIEEGIKPHEAHDIVMQAIRAHYTLTVDVQVGDE